MKKQPSLSKRQDCAYFTMAYFSKPLLALKVSRVEPMERVVFLRGHLVHGLLHFCPPINCPTILVPLFAVARNIFHFIAVDPNAYSHRTFFNFYEKLRIRTGDKAGSYFEVQSFSCSSCGICIDKCNLISVLVSPMFSRHTWWRVSANYDDVFNIAHNCLMCGRCDQACPVGIELMPIGWFKDGGDDEKDLRA